MHKNFKILIAEDESLVAEMIEGLLEELRHTVVAKVPNGFQAVEMVKKLQPTAVIMDIKMPDMGGIEAARRIAESCPTPVVVLSAFEESEIIEQASAAGIGAYLVKPPNAREMDRALTIAVARFEDMMALRRVNAELKEALQSVKMLSGLLPICANCKKIRDNHGHWYQVEEYIQNHSEVNFSHGICPVCAQKLYPEFVSS